MPNLAALLRRPSATGDLYAHPALVRRLHPAQMLEEHTGQRSAQATAGYCE